MSTLPSISDKIHTGLYCTDCACQTERDEIIQLRSTTKLLKNVHHEIELVKNELTFTRDSLRSAFYDELQTNAKTIYYQLIDKIDALRESHRKALETIRLSYRSQLHDFISQARNIIQTEKSSSSSESAANKQRSNAENLEKTFFQQAAIKGYETEINNLKLEIEQLRETSQHEIKLATSFLNDEKSRLSKELAIANQTLNHLEETLTKRDEQIRDLKYDLSSLQNKLKEATKKAAVREPEPPPKPPTQTRLVQTDPWKPPAPPVSSTPQKEVLIMKKPTVITLEPENETRSAMEKLEEKYEEIIREKDEQIQDLLQEINSQPKISVQNSRIEKHTNTEERHRNDLKRYAEKHRHEIQMWETKYDILHRSMMALRDEMYTRQTRVRERFNDKPAVST
ncbi:unnamed protein product [Adineta ricciae]|uniref:DUF4709 domain-containing protein n=1 Tax=Adineta ricciae TaxID=249248 RepID=A0A814X5V1_ADIRI|nr:unnamed protein product [Adineta ricciae]CAF1583386.1 unnamed protein product [Adineta ricciae]